MKIRINTKIIEALKPCKDQLVIWIENYKDFDGDILEFLELENISQTNKIWVATRVFPRFLVEVFAIDCAFSASLYASNIVSFSSQALKVYESSAASTCDIEFGLWTSIAAHTASTHAVIAASEQAVFKAAEDTYFSSDSDVAFEDSDVAFDVACAAQEQESQNQVDALIMLINGEGE